MSVLFSHKPTVLFTGKLSEFTEAVDCTFYLVYWHKNGGRGSLKITCIWFLTHKLFLCSSNNLWGGIMLVNV